MDGDVEHILEGIKDDIEQTINNIIESNPVKITKEGHKILNDRFGHNLDSYGVIYSDEYLLIPESQHNNWLYYAGFEYIDEGGVNKIGNYYIYEYYDSDRVANIIRLLNGQDEEWEDDE